MINKKHDLTIPGVPVTLRSNEVRILGIDPSLRNTGFARVVVDVETGAVARVERLRLVSTASQDKGVVRRSSDDLRRAQMLREALHQEAAGCHMAIVEMPSGSQSARGAKGEGICIGVLASCPIPMIEVSEAEVKLATVGRRTATKEDMMNFAMGDHPGADWIRHRGVLTNANEHLADATCAVYAGIRTEEFRRFVQAIEAAKRLVAAA